MIPDLAIFLPNVIRLLAIVLIMTYIFFIPYAVMSQHRPYYTWFSLLAQDCALVAGIIGMIYNWNKPLIWYYSPVLFIGGAAGCAYVVMSIRNRNRNQNPFTGESN